MIATRAPLRVAAKQVMATPTISRDAQRSALNVACQEISIFATPHVTNHPIAHAQYHQCQETDAAR
jgi:hypothetical protein